MELEHTPTHPKEERRIIVLDQPPRMSLDNRPRHREDGPTRLKTLSFRGDQREKRDRRRAQGQSRPRQDLRTCGTKEREDKRVLLSPSTPRSKPCFLHEHHRERILHRNKGSESNSASEAVVRESRPDENAVSTEDAPGTLDPATPQAATRMHDATTSIVRRS
jgi:hypothetical protein